MNENDNIFNNDVNNGNNQNNFTQPDNNQMNNNVNQQNDSNQNPINYSVSNNEQPVDTQNQSNTSNETNQFSNYQPSVKISTETSIISGNNDNKKNKKGLKIVLIILVIGLLAGAGFLFGPKLFDKKGSSSSSSKSKNNANIEGNIELIGEYDTNKDDTIYNWIEDEPYTLFAKETKNESTVIGLDGESIITIPYHVNIASNSLKYDDDYIVYCNIGCDTISVSDYDGNKKEFKKRSNSWYYFANGILYYFDSNSKLTAYDVKNDKKLWEQDYNGDFAYPLGNGYMVLSYHNDLYQTFSIVLDILDASTGEKIQLPECDNIAASLSTYYCINDNKSIDVYDYDNNKLGTFIDPEPEKYAYTANPLNTGGFILNQTPRLEGEKAYIIFNKYGKEIFRFTEDDNYKPTPEKMVVLSGMKSDQEVGDIESNTKYTIITARNNYKSYIIFDDDKYYEFYDTNAVTIAGNYAFGYADKESYRGKDNNNRKIRVVNLETEEEKIITGEMGLYLFAPKGNTNYFIFSFHNDKSIVYDKDFNIIYESKNSLKPINENYFLDVATQNGDDLIKIINAKTLEEKTLDTKGNYIYNDKYFLSTRSSDDSKTWLYKFK